MSGNALGGMFHRPLLHCLPSDLPAYTPPAPPPPLPPSLLSPPLPQTGESLVVSGQSLVGIDRGADVDESIHSHENDDIVGARRLMAFAVSFCVCALLLVAWLVAGAALPPDLLSAAYTSMAVKYPPQRLGMHEAILEEGVAVAQGSSGTSSGASSDASSSGSGSPWTEDAAAQGIG